MHAIASMYGALTRQKKSATLLEETSFYFVHCKVTGSTTKERFTLFKDDNNEPEQLQFRRSSM
jgi:hypothetical protein